MYRALFTIKGVKYIFRIIGLSFSESTDVALITLEQEGGDSGIEQLVRSPISLYLDYGEEVTLAGIEYDRASMKSVLTEALGHKINLNLRLSFGRGKVTHTLLDTERERMSLVSGATFHAAFRTLPGMSGSPIFHIREEDKNIPPLVCGIASSDWDDGEFTGDEMPAQPMSICSSVISALFLRAEDDKVFLDWLKDGTVLHAGIDPKHMQIIEIEPSVFTLHIDES